jgi:two-component system, sensor histidine kinase
MSAESQRLSLATSEQLRSIADTLPATVMGTAFASAALLYLLNATVDEPLGVTWLALLNCVGVARLILLWLYRKRSADDPRNIAILNALTACALVSGLAWAASVWILGSTEHVPIQAVAMFSCLAIATGGAFGTVASLRTAYAIFLPTALAPFVFGITHDGRYYHIVGVMTLLYTVILARMIHRLNRQFHHQIMVREQNQNLLLELSRRTEEAETANEAKSRFLIAASHDLRQPMQAIVLRARALSDLALPVEAKVITAHMDDAIGNMLELFDRLLDISQLETRAVVPHVTTFALKPLFARLQECYRDQAWEEAIELTVEPTPFWVTSDAVMLERILKQLLDNAVRHATRRSVALRARRLGDEVALEVRDTGPGIPRENHKDIFKEFVQLNNPQRDRRRGLGLGLSIVDRLARLLGHRLELESAVGEGSAFRICVPQAQARPALRIVPTTNVSGESLKGLLVAVLDDTQDVLEALNAMLRRWQCETIAATNSEVLTHAMRRAERMPDILICDYRLAETRNGIEVILALRRDLGMTCPALLITGDVVLRQDDTLTAADIVVLQKPVRPAALRGLLGAVAAERVRPEQEPQDA